MTVRLSRFACEAITGEEHLGAEHLPTRVVQAIRCYLTDADPGRLGWRYPTFMRDRAPGRVALELSIDDALWQALEDEAERQGVSTQQLVAHAVLYVAAEVHAGRITHRILEGIDGGGGLSPTPQGEQPRAPHRAL